MKAGNILADLPGRGPQECLETLASSAGVRVERIVSFGHASPPGFWYDQPHPEWVMVVEGRAGLEVEGQRAIVDLGPGDYVDIPAHCRHRVAWTSPDGPTVWLAVQYGDVRGEGLTAVRSEA